VDVVDMMNVMDVVDMVDVVDIAQFARNCHRKKLFSLLLNLVLHWSSEICTGQPA
jgi:hypothetical protein